MSDQKPVKRDEAWVDAAISLVDGIAQAESNRHGYDDEIIDARISELYSDLRAHLTAPDPRDAELALCRDLLRSAAVFLPRFARLQAVSGVNSPELRDLIASIKQTVGDTK